MPVQWKLKELLEREGKTVYALSEAMGGATRRPALYAITHKLPKKRPAKVGFEMLNNILAGLKSITGKTFSVADIIESDDVLDSQQGSK